MKGCLGMAIVFNLDSRACECCKLREQCANIVKDSLVSIHEQTDVTDYLQSMSRMGFDIEIKVSSNILPRAHKDRLKIKKKQIAPLKAELLSEMTKGAQKLGVAMLKIEDDIEQAIQEKRNPFIGAKPSYLAPVFELILQNNFSKDSLIDCLCSHNINWSKDTVRSHLYTIINTMVGIGIVERSGSRLKVRGQGNANI